jgi:hypothetical protein
MRLGIAAATALLLATSAAQGAGKYTWDGYGTGSYNNCFVYQMHIEFVVENGRAVGWWQQKDRVVRNFDLPLAGDQFSGKINIGTGDMNVKGNIGSSPEIRLTGYCNFGGPLKKV